MVKKTFILCLFVISSCGIVKAQNWSKEDSVWLANILEGKTELKINEDTKKAIEDGRLPVPSWMINEDGKITNIDIISDFNIDLPDSLRIRSIDPYSMPPAVYSLYILQMNKLDPSGEYKDFEDYNINLSDEEKEIIKMAKNNGTTDAMMRTIASRMAGNIGGMAGSGASINADFNHLLSMVFSPLYRLRMKNQKNAAIYNGYPRGPEYKLSESDRRRLNNNIIDIKKSQSNKVTFGIKRNGIDD